MKEYVTTGAGAGLWMRWAGGLGASGVVLGAFGAHALKARLTETGYLAVWETAVLYHLIHAVALLALAAACSAGVAPPSRARWVARCWLLGTILFSGSLYLLAAGMGRFWGPITPLGGVLLITGWVALAVGKPRRG